MQVIGTEGKEVLTFFKFEFIISFWILPKLFLGFYYILHFYFVCSFISLMFSSVPDTFKLSIFLTRGISLSEYFYF